MNLILFLRRFFNVRSLIDGHVIGKRSLYLAELYGSLNVWKRKDTCL